jgi:hypothetical protein
MISSRVRFISILVLVLLLSLGPAAGGANAGGLVTGVTNLSTNAPLAFNRVHDAGAQFVRIPLYWGGTAPTEEPAHWDPTNPNDPAYHWEESDEAVRNAVAAGLTPMLSVDGTPQWAQRCQTPPVLVPAICNPDPAALRSFATAAAKHFSGGSPEVPAVRYFVALNEPNLSLFFFPQFETNGKPLSPFLYRNLVNAFYAGVKSVNHRDIVVAAGLGPIAVPKYTIGPLRFAQLMLCMKGIKDPKPSKANCGGPVHFDIFAIQPYTTGGPTHKGAPDDVEIGDLPKLQRLLAAADRAGHIAGHYKHTPLWVTEFSWDSKPPDPHGLPMAIETRWVAEALHTAWSAGVSHFFWFSLRDEAREGRPASEALESGLYFRGPTLAKDQPKPFLSAFRFPFVAYPGKPFTFWGRTPTSRSGPVKIEFLEHGHWKTVATVSAKKTGIFQGTLHTAYGAGEVGSARAVFGGQASAAFSMKPVPDFVHPPFG